jgi:hypothetical protein
MCPIISWSVDHFPETAIANVGEKDACMSAHGCWCFGEL